MTICFHMLVSEALMRHLSPMKEMGLISFYRYFLSMGVGCLVFGAVMVALAQQEPPEPPQANACAEIVRPAADAAVTVEGRAWKMGGTVSPCGKWHSKNNFRSGTYNIHRYGLSTFGAFEMTIHLQHTEGEWLPDLVLTTEDGRVVYRHGVPSKLAGVTATGSRPAPRDVELRVSSPKALGLFLHVTDAQVTGGNKAAEIPRDAHYRIRMTQTCAVEAPRPCPITHSDIWNTYYFVADERDYPGRRIARLHDPKCRTIARVSADYSDTVCIQGSGTLRDGRVINFARTCSCGRECPTGGIVCYATLDKTRFPWGMGSRRNPLVPLRSIAVDNGLVPHGALVYIPFFDGLFIPKVGAQGGFTHDGCFRADDIGGGIRNNHIDIFSGKRAMYKALETLLPTRSRFPIMVDAERCRGVLPEVR